MPHSPRLLRPANNFTPRSISGLALWLDGADTSSLYTTDAGPVVPVTAPTDIAGCLCWYDASDAASITKDGSNLVSQWNDKSENLRHAAASGSLRPTSGGSQNGRTVMQFTGTQAMTITGNFLQSDNVTMFAVAMKNTDHYGGIISSAPSDPEDSPILCFYLTTIAWLNRRVLVQQATGNGVYRIVSGQSNGTSQQGAFDGVRGTDTTASVATNTTNTITKIGALRTSSTSDLNGNIAEIICYSGSLSTADRARVEAYLAAKWGITGVHRAARDEIAPVSSPTDLAGCAGWWDCSRTDKMFNATSGGSLVADGAAVLRLEDLSGNGKHLVQSTSGDAPTRQDGGQNGLPCLNFAGTKTATAGSIGDWNFLHNTNGGTVFAVIKPFGSADPQAFAYGVSTNFGGNSNGVGWSTFFDDRVSGYSRNNYLHHAVHAGTSGQSVIFQEQNNGLSAANEYSLLTSVPFAGAPTAAARGGMYVTGTATGAANSATLAPVSSNSTSALTVGAAGNGIYGLAELIVFNYPLSNTDRARVEKYLANKWGIANVPDPTPPVGYWADKSGNARHATQATSSLRPIAGTTNSRRSLRFDGSDDRLGASIAPSDLCSESGGSAFVVVAPNNDSVYTSFTNSGAIEGFDRFITNNVSYYGNFRTTRLNAVLPGAFNTNGAQIIASVASVGTQTVRKDGASVLSVADQITGYRAASSSLSVTIGATLSTVSPLAYSYYLDGNVAEIICYNKPLSERDARKVEGYLAAKWGIALAPQVSNADAQDWINRVYANGGTVSASTAAAVNQFCNAIDAESGLRACFYRLNPHAGGTSGTVAGLNASLVPLYRGPAFGGATFGGSVDTNTGGLFIPSDYSEAAGLQGNGSKYLNTGLPMNFTAARNLHLCAVAGGFQLGNQSTLIAADTNGDGTSPRFYQGLVSFSGTPRVNVFYNIGSGFSQSQVGSTYSNAMLLGSGNSSGNTLYANGSSVGTDAEAGATANTNTYPLYVFASNNRNLATPLNIANCLISAYSAGLYMTPAQVSAYTAAMKTLQESLGRVSW